MDTKINTERIKKFIKIKKNSIWEEKDLITLCLLTMKKDNITKKELNYKDIKNQVKLLVKIMSELEKEIS
ncbi:hypothetical protein [Haliovirga abyssi]|uniref:Uncharacterized protein n=1 Tax=Haliovirga abyssi TaxID=2996794 RepID=A0AAU9DSN3_9FUSO|nr:hypothetical protein [Haliovirga abyssi]BDU51643.1 hypothetical protein HLVA_22120 [Haliovirga abyssi]